MSVFSKLAVHVPYPLPVEKILEILVVTFYSGRVGSIVLWRIPTPTIPITLSVKEFFNQMKS